MKKGAPRRSAQYLRGQDKMKWRPAAETVARQNAMSNSHLNSVHLPALRREQFRLARAAVMGTTGDQTLACSLRAPLCEDELDRTGFQSELEARANRTRFVLVDNDQVHRLKVGINTVGRLSDNDVVVADPYVSRRHIAIIVHAHGNCELHDVASKNGTLINGRSIAGPTPLNSGDQIRLSDHLLVFLIRPQEPEDMPEGDHTQAD